MAWVAVDCEGMMQEGATQPTRIVCRCTVSDEEAPFVVKDLNGHEVTEAALCRELLGNGIARALGVRTPEPVVIEIPADVARRSEDVLRDHRLPLGEGWAAGTRFIERRMPFTAAQSLAHGRVQEATELYASDLVAHNIDRDTRNPNLFIVGDSIVAYDFERCFDADSFRRQGADPWEVWSHPSSKTHCLRSRLAEAARRGHRGDLKPFVERLAFLDADSISSRLNLPQRPSGCIVAHAAAHIKALLEHVPEFLEDVRRLLT